MQLLACCFIVWYDFINAYCSVAVCFADLVLICLCGCVTCWPVRNHGHECLGLNGMQISEIRIHLLRNPVLLRRNPLCLHSFSDSCDYLHRRVQTKHGSCKSSFRTCPITKKLNIIHCFDGKTSSKPFHSAVNRLHNGAFLAWTLSLL